MSAVAAAAGGGLICDVDCTVRRGPLWDDAFRAALSATLGVVSTRIGVSIMGVGRGVDA